MATIRVSKVEAVINEDVEFDDNTPDAGNSRWDFGDGEYDMTPHARHIYTEPGNYTVKLTSSGSFGIITGTKEITVKPAEPAKQTIAITGNSTVKAGATNSFTANASAGTKYKWSVKDDPNNIQSQPTANFNFKTPGIKTIILDMELEGAHQTITKDVVVEANAPAPPVQHQNNPPKSNNKRKRNVENHDEQFRPPADPTSIKVN